MYMEAYVKKSVVDNLLKEYSILKSAHKEYLNKIYKNQENVYLPSYYGFYIQTHYPFTTKYNIILNNILRKEKIKKLLKY